MNLLESLDVMIDYYLFEHQYRLIHHFVGTDWLKCYKELDTLIQINKKYYLEFLESFFKQFEDKF